MSTAVTALEPKAIWKHFAALNAVPRPSKKEERVIAFMLNFGKELGLPVEKDDAGNVLIRKSATPGMEDRKTIVLQSHLDMVHQKNEGTAFDFETEGIRMKVDGDWVKAEGTTLGADNGLGVATIMAILAADDLEHPAIEALFTIDEETGMTGAFQLRPDWLQGQILLNLDTEEDDEIGVGCAGGIDVTGTRSYTEKANPGNTKSYRVKISGLSGGHSGMDIHKNLGNANKLMNTLLRSGGKFKMYLSSLQGGSLRNAIPRESVAEVAVDFTSGEIWKETLLQKAEALTKEFKDTDPHFLVEIDQIEEVEKIVDEEVQQSLLDALENLHNGVYTMSKAIPDLVETSNNIAKVMVMQGKIQVECLTRSSSEDGKAELVADLTAIFKYYGFNVATGGSYPGWNPNMNSPIVKVLEKTYTDLFSEKPHVAACHAGLECGIIGQQYPEMDMVSYGPTIKGAHSPDERVSISSVQKFWKLTKEVLVNIPGE
ncbi:aminoacyl-histidine dipeptidase [Aquimarina sp. ERC-38]|uniref:aminoacyl-histidine dipeptidase n=1 Tax=Aquimarina sp. ERC-38 TaxID=2949996 RepID=UPI002246CE9C|nr:aminoacyl-histidine dipeptidase [Aquimarina sp. ERC-38]UZO80409.1 aminoacyl-histidine dipeptidase [Aquimarina sp. ERC-38]